MPIWHKSNLYSRLDLLRGKKVRNATQLSAQNYLTSNLNHGLRWLNSPHLLKPVLPPTTDQATSCSTVLRWLWVRSFLFIQNSGWSPYKKEGKKKKKISKKGFVHLLQGPSSPDFLRPWMRSQLGDITSTIPHDIWRESSFYTFVSIHTLQGWNAYRLTRLKSGFTCVKSSENQPEWEVKLVIN